MSTLLKAHIAAFSRNRPTMYESETNRNTTVKTYDAALFLSNNSAPR